MVKTLNMTKKLVFSVIALAMAVSPFLSVKADNGDWDAAISAAAWNYGDYRVERLAFADDAIGPFNLGEFVLVAEPVDSKPNEEPLYNVYMLEDGLKLLMENVPEEALDAQRFALNDGRFVFISQVDWDGDHYAVTEYDGDGDAEQLVEDVFFSGVEDIDVLVDGADIYFETSHDFTGKTALKQTAVYVYDEAEGDADIVGKHWELREEKLLDAADGKVLIKMTFSSGNKQLWLGDTHNVNYQGMTREAISGTWVDPEADIFAAHFIDDDTVEFFMNYVRHTYDLDTEVLTKHDGQFLNWYGAPEDAYQLDGVYMAWVTPENTLMLSDGSNVKTIGTAADGQFLLEDGRLFYASGSAGKVYDIAARVTVNLPFAVTDVYGDIVVGNDAAGNVSYMDMNSGEAYDLGYGSAPAISDEMHVYWMGVDGAIYEGTVSLPSVLSVGSIRAMKLASDNTVYLVKDGEKLVIPSEKTYFTWFDSWSDVEIVTAAKLNGYADGGVASFAPGTKVKLARDPKVYVVGNDGKLHWITTQTVAYSIFGSTWNKGILEINQQDLVTNPLGSAIESESDLQTI
jgi:hypothetical protein